MIRSCASCVRSWRLGISVNRMPLRRRSDRNRSGASHRRARYRDSDAVPHPARAVARLVPAFQKVSGARRTARHLSRQRNRSTSFHAFMRGIDVILAEMGDSDAVAIAADGIESGKD